MAEARGLIAPHSAQFVQDHHHHGVLYGGRYGLTRDMLCQRYWPTRLSAHSYIGATVGIKILVSDWKDGLDDLARALYLKLS